MGGTMSRRLLFTAILFFGALTAQSAQQAVDYVDPFIGTAIHTEAGLLGGGLGGNTLPAASYPFGMVQWGPDTARVDSGVFEFTQNAISGFSLTHMSGPGCLASGEFPVLPVVGSETTVGYSHHDEVATPGYYAVTLDNGVGVRLAVTPRSGIGTFTFPQSGGQLIVNAALTPRGPMSGHIDYVNDHEISGWIETGLFCNAKNKSLVNFSLISQTPFQFHDLGGGKVGLGYTGAQTVTIKVGISFVSVAGARNNWGVENPGWDLTAVKNAARQAWQDKLSVIQADSDDGARLKVFYTALYHTLLHPNVFSDVPQAGKAGGEYPGFDDPTTFATYNGTLPRPRMAIGYTQYANFSGWDIYRSQSQFLAWLYPKQANDMMKSLVATADQCGAFPKWAYYNRETAIMNGDPPAGIVAGSYAFGARDFDTDKALTYLKFSGLNPKAACYPNYSRWGIQDFIDYGYLPFDPLHPSGSVATALEYNVADYAVAQFAKALGEESTYEHFLARSKTWKQNYDVSTGFMRPRQADGSWVTPFDPAAMEGFVEGNAYQYLWFVPHDARALIDIMGGDAVAIQRLDAHFSKVNSGPTSPYFYIGNEPSFHTPWLYNYTNMPSRTQYQVRRIMDQSFTTNVNGLPGNDDLGAMSSWYVFSAMGVFPALPGEAKLALASPAFKNVVIHLPSGNTLSLHAPQAPNVYIQKISARVTGSANAVDVTTPWLPEAMIFSGGDVNYDLGTAPNDGIWSQQRLSNGERPVKPGEL